MSTTDFRAPTAARSSARHSTSATAARSSARHSTTAARTSVRHGTTAARTSARHGRTAARTAALRAADGVIAGYIRSLARVAAAPATSGPARPKLHRPVALPYECGASRSNGVAARRRLPLRRVPSPA